MGKKLLTNRCKNCGSSHIEIKDGYAFCPHCKSKFIIKNKPKENDESVASENNTTNIYSQNVKIDPVTKKIMSYQKRDSAVVYLWALLLPIIFALVISIIIASSAKGEDGNIEISSQTWFLILTRILSSVMLAGLFFVYNKKKNISHRACGITKKTNYLFIPIAIILGVSVVYLSDNFITTLAFLIGKIGINVNASIGLPLTNFWWLLLSVFLIGVLPAVTEELIYRGMIFNGLKKMGKWPAILLSALAFCLMHGSIPQFPYTFLLGIVLGYVMWETGALWLCMLIHFCNNATVLVSMYVAAQQGVSSTMPTSLSTGYVLLAIGLMALAVLLVFFMFFLMKKIKNKYKVEESNLDDEKTEEQPETNELFTKVKNEQKYNGELNAVQREGKKTNILLICGYALAVLLTIIQTI